MRLLPRLAWAFGPDAGSRRTRPRKRLRAAGIGRSFDDRLRAYRVPVGLPVAVACVMLAHPTPYSMIAGAAVAALGLVIRGAAAGHLVKHTALTTSGPYAVVRHPLYLGSAVVAAGLLVAAASSAAALLVAAYFAVFYPLAMQREEEKLGRHYGSVFAGYADRVSALRPGSLGAAVRTWRFSWSLYRYNGEFQSTLGVLAALAILWLRMRGGALAS